MVSKTPPSWFKALSDLGCEMASQPNRTVGERFPVVVLSVPTGQFTTWAISNGALSSIPKIVQPQSFPSRCVAWDNSLEQVGEVTVEEVLAEGRLVPKIGGVTYLNGIASVRLPDNAPEDFGQGRVLTKKERDRLNSQLKSLGLATKTKPWFMGWAEQCLSPIVIIGRGQEYVLNQLHQLHRSEFARDWLNPLSIILTSVESGKITDADQILRVPISVLSPEASRDNDWIQQISPRLVIYTRWSYFEERPPGAFTGVPTIVISNRRVESSIDCAAATNHIKVNPAGWLTTANQLPRGISIRYLEPPVVSSEVYDPTDDWGEEF